MRQLVKGVHCKVSDLDPHIHKGVKMKIILHYPDSLSPEAEDVIIEWVRDIETRKEVSPLKYVTNITVERGENK